MATNTEKPMTKSEQKRQVVEAPKADKKVENKAPVQDKKVEDKKTGSSSNAITPPKEEKKPEKKVVKKVKKEEVVVNSYSVPVSTKYAISICKFIKNKTIEKAIADLEEVQGLRKAVPMKGEIPHRKGKMMSGRFPAKASGYFIKILKTLKGNADNHDVDEPFIFEAIANKASRPMARFGRWERKRTHITIKAKSRIKKANKKPGEKQTQKKETKEAKK